MKVVRYDCQGAPTMQNAEKVLQDLGIEVIKGAYSTYGACYFFQIKETDKQLPEYLVESSYDFSYPV